MQFTESLETRRHLHADLSVALTSTTLPTSLVVGAKAKPAVAALTVSNSGDALEKTNKNNVVLTVGLVDAEGVFNLLGTANIVANKFAKTTPVKSTVKLAVPSTLAAGTYTLTARLDAAAADSDELPAGNSATSPQARTVSVLNSELFIAAAVSTLPAVAAAGADATMDVSVVNLGNADAKAKGVVEIIATKDNVTTVLGTSNVNLTAKAMNQETPLVLKKLKFNAPEAAGTYTLAARFASTTAIGDTSFGNELPSATLTVTAGSTPGSSDRPFPGSNLPATISFRAEQTGLPEVDGGSHSNTTNDLIGPWSQTRIAGKNIFSLGVTAEPQTSVVADVSGYTGDFADKTITFGVPKAGSSGSLKLNGTKTVIYFKVA